VRGALIGAAWRHGVAIAAGGLLALAGVASAVGLYSHPIGLEVYGGTAHYLDVVVEGGASGSTPGGRTRVQAVQRKATYYWSGWSTNDVGLNRYGPEESAEVYIEACDRSECLRLRGVLGGRHSRIEIEEDRRAGSVRLFGRIRGHAFDVLLVPDGPRSPRRVGGGAAQWSTAAERLHAGAYHKQDLGMEQPMRVRWAYLDGANLMRGIRENSGSRYANLRTNAGAGATVQDWPSR
jgi:hypothetical protein